MSNYLQSIQPAPFTLVIQYFTPKERERLILVSSLFRYKVREVADLEAWGKNWNRLRNATHEDCLRIGRKLQIEMPWKIYQSTLTEGILQGTRFSHDYEFVYEMIKSSLTHDFNKAATSLLLSAPPFIPGNIVDRLAADCPEFVSDHQAGLFFLQQQFKYNHVKAIHSTFYKDFVFAPGELLTILKTAHPRMIRHLSTLPLSREEKCVLAKSLLSQENDVMTSELSSHDNPCSQTLEYMHQLTDEEKLSVLTKWIITLKIQLNKASADESAIYLPVLNQIEKETMRLMASQKPAGEIVHYQQRALDWFFSAMGELRNGLIDLSWARHSQILLSLFNYKEPEGRKELTGLLADISPDSYAALKLEDSPLESKYEFTKLVRCILSHKYFRESPQAIHHFFIKINQLTDEREHPYFWDIDRFRTLMQTLLAVQKIPLFNSSKIAIIKKLTNEIDLNNPRATLLSLEALRFILNNPAHLNLELLGQDLRSFEKIMEELLNHIFPIKPPKGMTISEAFKNTFFKDCRAHEYAILTYYTNLSKLKTPEDAQVIPSLLNYYIEPVLNGEFYEKLYSLDLHPHLAALHQIDPTFVDKWKQLPPFTPTQEVPRCMAGITHNYEDRLLCGTEVAESCLGVNKCVDNSKGLSGYLIHPQTHLITIKNKKGRIVARSVLRAMINTATGKINLFLEDAYYNQKTPKFQKGCDQVIEAIAFKRAKELGVPLVLSKNKKGNLMTHPGPAAYESYDRWSLAPNGKIVL